MQLKFNYVRRVDVCQFDAPSGNELTRRQFTFEFEDGLYLNRLPLDLRVGHYWVYLLISSWLMLISSAPIDNHQR